MTTLKSNIATMSVSLSVLIPLPVPVCQYHMKMIRWLQKFNGKTAINITQQQQQNMNKYVKGKRLHLFQFLLHLDEYIRFEWKPFHDMQWLWLWIQRINDIVRNVLQIDDHNDTWRCFTIHIIDIYSRIVIKSFFSCAPKWLDSDSASLYNISNPICLYL